VFPIKTATGAWPTTNTLAYRKLVGTRITNGRATAQFPTNWTTNVLEKAAAALERTDFPEKGFPGACHKKTRRTSTGFRVRQQLADAELDVTANYFTLDCGL